MNKCVDVCVHALMNVCTSECVCDDVLACTHE